MFTRNVYCWTFLSGTLRGEKKGRSLECCQADRALALHALRMSCNPRRCVCYFIQFIHSFMLVCVRLGLFLSSCCTHFGLPLMLLPFLLLRPLSLRWWSLWSAIYNRLGWVVGREFMCSMKMDQWIVYGKARAAWRWSYDRLSTSNKHVLILKLSGDAWRWLIRFYGLIGHCLIQRGF